MLSINGFQIEKVSSDIYFPSNYFNFKILTAIFSTPPSPVHSSALVIESGKLGPRDTTVTDYYTNQKRENPKSETELEFLKQFFVLFDLDNNLLYFLDVRHRNLLEKILKDTTEVKFNIKGFYEDKEEFFKKII